MKNRLKTLALTSCAVIALATAAHAQDTAKFDIAGGDLKTALQTFATQTSQEVLFSTDIVAGRRTKGVSAQTDPQTALVALLDGTGLTFNRTPTGTLLVVRASAPQSGSAAGDGADGTVAALVVTAQKREENIQDVPIAMSAFTQEDLTRSQVAGGPDLMTQVPNFTFTKTNFSGYSIQIRGIGTQAISATTDPAVAVAENNTPFIRNRFFEQEFYDLQRIEVLRGPQGTLYGRNATAGVVNIITAKPTFHQEARLSADLGNYNATRLEGMLNIPLVEDKVAVRLAGAWTKRDGYDTNQITGNRIDGRDLWSTRLTLRFEPTDNIHANLMWEHFNEDDDRLRSGKQLCHTDVVSHVGPVPVEQMEDWHGSTSNVGAFLRGGIQATLSQGCGATSLYAPESFQTPNGLSLPYYLPVSAIFLPTALVDPYMSRTQSHNLRQIESTVDPKYRARTDTAELQLSVDIGDHLTFTSETGYSADTLFSMEDYNRFNTAAGAWLQPEDTWLPRQGVLQHGPNGGIFCDPQIGCADRLVAMDVSTAKSRQFSQEFRLASDFGGPFNFSVGANFTRYDTEDKYYVFINSLTMYAALSPFSISSLPPYVAGASDNGDCLRQGLVLPDPGTYYPVGGCQYIDPNPVGSLNDLGHNYFLSRNPYKLISYAVFGEAYYNITPTLKLTTGLRWTVDRKQAPRIPSWVLGGGLWGTVASGSGYSVAEVVNQEWREPTGRLALDWKPDLSFTDETLIYGSYARGYKAGGANPPSTGIVCYGCSGISNSALQERSATHPKTFGAEYVNAFELGAKNTLFGGTLTLNGAAFYYDYTGYQISQIVDRSAINMNFDARVWGLELESDWRPVENLRLGLKLGYEKTRVADGMKAIDVMDRTAGHSDWVVVRPFPTFPSNCVLPVSLFIDNSTGAPQVAQVGNTGNGGNGPCEIAYVMNHDPITDAPYVDLSTVTGPVPTGFNSTLFFHPGYTGWNPALDYGNNHGEGFYKDLSGKELPNAPHYTATITADYTLPLPNNWLATLHGDFYYQAESWARIFNTPGYDKLKAYNNVNLAAIFTNQDAGWKIMAYVKNVFDKTNMTGAFLNSDDTGLTTNVFLNEPRLYGLRVTKEWTGQGWWTGANSSHTGPYPFTVEIGGQIQRRDAPYETMAPGFADAFSSAVNPTTAQNRDLDWGDGREVRVTYRPSAASWSVSAAMRYGKTNSGANRLHQSEVAGDRVCAFPMDGPFGRYGHALCDPTYSFFGGPPGQWYNLNNFITPTDWSDATARNEEEHTIVDFSVGKDVGLGGLFGHDSSIGAGIRYADLKSTTAATMDGIPDWQVQAWQWYPSTHDRYAAHLHADRGFKGAGPALSWNAGVPLWGGDETGRVSVDWGVAGGVLFGKQKTAITGYEASGHFTAMYMMAPANLPPLTSTPVKGARSKSATVSVVDLSLGLSYDIQRIKVGAGYRWERYFNAIDGGFEEHKSYDRTFDGPYFNIAIGFGG